MKPVTSTDMEMGGVENLVRIEVARGSLRAYEDKRRKNVNHHRTWKPEMKGGGGRRKHQRARCVGERKFDVS